MTQWLKINSGISDSILGEITKTAKLIFFFLHHNILDMAPINRGTDSTMRLTCEASTERVLKKTNNTNNTQHNIF